MLQIYCSSEKEIETEIIIQLADEFLNIVKKEYLEIYIYILFQ